MYDKQKYDKLIDIYASDLDRLRQLEDLHKKKVHLMELKNEKNYCKPYIIDFAGTPNAGIDTTITMMTDFFKNYGYDVVNIKENNNTIKEMEKIMYIAKNHDLVFINRGVLDGYIKYIVNCEGNNKNFYLACRKFLKDIDKIVVMRCDPMVAAKRKYFNTLALEPNFDLFPENIKNYNEALTKGMMPLYDIIKDTYMLDTTKLDKTDAAIKVCDNILGGYKQKML